MFLIADSGSSKADWVLTGSNSGTLLEFRTNGINPFFLSEKEITKILLNIPELQPYLKEVKEIYFFGAGCSSPDRREVVSNALSQIFKNAFVNVENDLAAAVYATCGNKEGLSCILGTGSNITYFDGKEIHPGNHGLGYVLGDEGSGTYFGKKLITSYLYGTLPLHLHKAFQEAYNLTKTSVIKQVYENPSPNFYLASFAHFMSSFKTDPFIVDLLTAGFDEFIQTNIKAYPNYNRLTCHFIGSIAYHFQDTLKEVCRVNNIRTGKILKHPIEELNKFILEREMKDLA
ncbi:N-acetylglucosamine kinase [Flavihumibacter sp. R14]|nr:N-acetylglucosamine kinase [Flavihumibacter soli]